MPVSKTFETINVGSAPQSGDGEPLRNGGIKINNNFDKALENNVVIAVDYTEETVTIDGDLFVTDNLGIGTTTVLANDLLTIGDGSIGKRGIRIDNGVATSDNLAYLHLVRTGSYVGFVDATSLGLAFGTSGTAPNGDADANSKAIMMINRITKRVGVLTTTPNANLDTTPGTIDTYTYTRPFPTVTTAQRNALTGMVTGVGVYDTDENLIRIYNGSSFIASGIKNIVYVNSVLDLPTPVGGEHQLVAGTLYYMRTSVIISSSRLLLPPDGACGFVGGSFIYTGTGAAIKLVATSISNRTFTEFGVQATNASGEIFDISATGAGIGALFVWNLSTVYPINGTDHGASKIGIVKNVTLVVNRTQIVGVKGALDIEDVVAADISAMKTDFYSGATGTHLKFGGTSNGIIQISGFSPLIDTGQKGIYFNPAATYSGVTLSNSIPSFQGSATKDDIFQPGSYNQTTIGFKFSGNVNISDSTVKGDAVVTGGALTTIIPAQNAWVIANIAGWVSNNTEQLTINTNGYATYLGLEDVSILLDGNINLEPVTASKDLSCKFCCINAEDRTVTFTNATNIINETATPRVNGNTISFKNTLGTLPAGLRKDVIYYVVNKATNTFQVSYTLGGAAIAFTDDGTPPNSYSLTSLRGSQPVQPIGSGAPRDLIPQADGSVGTGCETLLVVSNRTDAVNITVRSGYYRVAKI